MSTLLQEDWTCPYHGFQIYARKRHSKGFDYFEIKAYCPVYGIFRQRLYTSDIGEVRHIIDLTKREAEKGGALPNKKDALFKILQNYPNISSPPNIITKNNLIREVRDAKTLENQLHSIIKETLAEFARDMNGRQTWELVPFNLWARVRTEFFSYGHVRSHNALLNIIEVLTDNVLKLVANTDILYYFGGGYNGYQNPVIGQALQQNDLGEEEVDIFSHYIDDEQGRPRMSDTAADKLWSNIEDLHKATSLEEQIVTIDHIFDIAHPRSDLASWLIEGGSASLSKLTS